jgi:hypothetical protein
MNAEGKNILIAVALCLSGGLLAVNSTSASVDHARTSSPALTPVIVSNTNSVFMLAKSVEWAGIDNEPMWPTF